MTTQRFTSVDQSAIYVVGRLEGLCGTTRYEIEPELKAELKELAELLKEQVLATTT